MARSWTSPSPGPVSSGPSTEQWLIHAESFSVSLYCCLLDQDEEGAGKWWGCLLLPRIPGAPLSEGLPVTFSYKAINTYSDSQRGHLCLNGDHLFLPSLGRDARAPATSMARLSWLHRDFIGLLVGFGLERQVSPCLSQVRIPGFLK